MATILLAEDDIKISTIYRKWLETAGYAVFQAENGLTGLRNLTLGRKPDLLVSDVMMPDVDGEQLVGSLDTLFPGVPAIIVTALSDSAKLAELSTLPNVRRVLRKPVQREDLLKAVAEALGA